MPYKRQLSAVLTDKLQHSNKVIIVYGARQCGKTTLCKEIIAGNPFKTLEINADQSKYLDILSSRDLKRLKALTEGYALLFIDEAQRIPDIGINLKILKDEVPDLKILITGSSSISIAKSTNETLTGRKLTYTLFPVSLTEASEGKNNFETIDLFDDLLVHGSYPEVLTTVNLTDKEELLHEIVRSYLYKDILEMAHVEYSHKIKDLLRLLAFQTGSEVSINELSKSLGINRQTVERYIDLLEKSFVIYALGGFGKNLRKEISKQRKYYFYDLGVRNCIIGNFAHVSQRNDTGALWENFVINEREKQLEYNRIFAESYFWRTYSGAEIDYIEVRNNQINAFEIKYTKRKAKIPQSFIDAYPHTKYNVICKENMVEFADGLGFIKGEM